MCSSEQNFARQATRHLRQVGRRGFTLLEIMIALLIFSVGMMAVMTMNFSAINAYTSSRDQTIGSQLGYRTLALIKAEAANDGDPVYNAGTGTVKNPFNTNSQSLFTQLAAPGNAWAWQTATLAPVNEQLNPVDTNYPTTTARFCIFARGNDMGATAGADTVFDATTVQVLQTQIAVVYPSNNRSLPANFACATIGTECGGTIEDLLKPGTINDGAAGTIALELCGMRVVHMGGIVRRNITGP